MDNVVIAGVGKSIPSKVVTNDMLSQIVDTNDEWITSRTGIKQRHITTGENTSDIASKAALNALENANIDALDIDLIIVATCTPDMFTPATACIVQKNIGAKNAFAFDLSAACSGFIYGINVAKSMMKQNNIKKSLVIGAETLSKTLDWKDRSTCVLFGDGAGAAVLSLDQNEGIIDVICNSKGAKWENLTIGAKDINNPYVDEVSSINHYLQMNGGEIFKFATVTIVKLIKEILKKNNLILDDIDYIVPHQANERIIQFAAKKLDISMDKFYINIHEYGNTSAASIPIAISEMEEKNLLKRGNKIIAVGFGAGLTSGACLIEWTK
ncbi:beta-ketoacyl-ACP synthase III [Intestinibacter sp.]|uniref:beta-ketoacyl-ACP synthase III n=1 Tax=Intestinibacter sp. TaxID=1965304 RepID=UPI002A763500|nr:beta-ketoacyl-ACP synthase III [Intestinibacter sp.]MDY2736028.1 beta-ketoacyl-ACP synthase III [Intestinibacter sp.]MDY4575477.1 beta-ketoacyl-ACP synthase III [Intestinibacter sp.]